MRTAFASFLKFYHKEYDEIKHIPINRLWGYFDFMAEYHNNLNKDPEDIKRENIDKVDWNNEVKELKKNGTRKT
ncbi:MAG: hypothetical protein PHW73_01295 [Atribacterota bacterium]|nr:hypothetical protein [Atribacterota bacterium]